MCVCVFLHKFLYVCAYMCEFVYLFFLYVCLCVTVFCLRVCVVSNFVFFLCKRKQKNILKQLRAILYTTTIHRRPTLCVCVYVCVCVSCQRVQNILLGWHGVGNMVSAARNVKVRPIFCNFE